ncbi:MAG TPA: hypothetical protein VFF79_12320 [Conexibacter sp.]|nr:hypothetical protein [Conexibacter sp.]
MPAYDGMLLRDALTDDGSVPSPGYPYYSPDLICYPQVANPQTFFTANYTSDPNQAAQLGTALNRVYVRGKNLAPTPLSGWNVFLYRASSSLFMTPSIWVRNQVPTFSGGTYVSLPATQPQGIAVGSDCFMLSGLSSNLFCLVGVATAGTSPSIPATFASYGDYVSWVRQNQNVCGRNLSLAQSFPNRQYERLDAFSNPASESVPTLFRVALTGTLPAGSTFGLVCAPLNVNTSWSISQGPVQTASGMTPAAFNGTVTTWASLPSGTTRWPSGVRLDTTVYVGIDSEHPASAFAAPPEELAITADEAAALMPSGTLVRLGNCATVFQTS